MVVRRFREHVAEHNWFAVVVDVGIVVLGVFLGLQANNWNQARIERAEANDFRQQIIQDLKTNEVDLVNRKTYYGSVRAHALKALDALESPGGLRDQQSLIDFYQASQVWLRPLTRTGYDALNNAGLGGRIGDQQARSLLTAYYTQIRQFDLTALGSTGYRDRVRRALPYRLQQAINKECGDRITTLSGGDQTASLPDKCSVDLDPALVRIALERVARADLREDLNRHIADLDQKLSGFDRFGRSASSLRHLLEMQG